MKNRDKPKYPGYLLMKQRDWKGNTFIAKDRLKELGLEAVPVKSKRFGTAYQLRRIKRA